MADKSPNAYQKLQECRVKLQTMQVKATGNNKFAGYSYLELGDFLPKVQELFNESGLCGIVSFTQHMASLAIHNISDPAEFITFESPMSTAELKGCHPIQNLGAVQSYLRRYLYLSAMEIVEHDALDATTGKDKEPPKSPPPKKDPPKQTQDPKIIGYIQSAVTLDELKAVWNAIPKEQQMLYFDLKELRKTEITS